CGLEMPTGFAYWPAYNIPKVCTCLFYRDWVYIHVGNEYCSTSQELNQHEGSIVTVESLSAGEKQIWRTIRKELEDIGITVATFDAHKDAIMDRFKEAIATGAFEQTPEDVSGSGSCGNQPNNERDSSITISIFSTEEQGI